MGRIREFDFVLFIFFVFYFGLGGLWFSFFDWETDFRGISINKLF